MKSSTRPARLHIINMCNLYAWNPNLAKWRILDGGVLHDEVRNSNSTFPLHLYDPLKYIEATLTIYDEDNNPLFDELERVQYEIYKYADPVLGPKDNALCREGPALFTSQPLQDAHINNDNKTIKFKINKSRFGGAPKKEYVLRFFLVRDVVLQTHSYPIAVMTKVPREVQKNTL